MLGFKYKIQGVLKGYSRAKKSFFKESFWLCHFLPMIFSIVISVTYRSSFILAKVIVKILIKKSHLSANMTKIFALPEI